MNGTMIKTIIIDDEMHCINRLKSLISNYHQNQISVLDAFQSVESGIKGIEALKPDLVFLDIQIGAKNGFDVLKHFDKIDFDVIFTTAYDQYAVLAFKCSAVYYLLKPIDIEDLNKSLEKLAQKLAKEDIVKKFDTLLYNLSAKESQEKRIAIPTVSGYHFIRVAEIIRCESNVNYTTMFLIDKQKITVAKTLKEYEDMLHPFGFFRVHNSHLINMFYVKSYNKGKTGIVTLTDGKEIDVSSRRKDAFLEKLKAF